MMSIEAKKSFDVYAVIARIIAEYADIKVPGTYIVRPEFNTPWLARAIREAQDGKGFHSACVYDKYAVGPDGWVSVIAEKVGFWDAPSPPFHEDHIWRHNEMIVVCPKYGLDIILHCGSIGSNGVYHGPIMFAFSRVNTRRDFWKSVAAHKQLIAFVPGPAVCDEIAAVLRGLF